MIKIEIRIELMVFNMGFYYLFMYGVLCLIVILDGEDVVDCELVIGYLYWGMEKIVESCINIMYVFYVSCWDYVVGMFNEVIIVNVLEKLVDIEVFKWV